jgi:D-alanyl-D-alanine carboxypeptidase/D-alanyl-D-alanine-endopeptidase (penicillin-binding protein 4)
VELFKNIPVVYPTYFKKFLTAGEPKKRPQVIRDFHSNDFKFHAGTTATRTTRWDVPMHIDHQLITELLSDTLKKTVTPTNTRLPEQTNVLHSVHVDSLYHVMMQESDNFIAEQLLLMCADAVSDTLQPEIAIRYMKKNFLSDLPDEPSWVDGSGLSRYNLITPRSVVELWKKIYALVPEERLLPLLATGGKNGTVKNWYKAEKPYFFGKTGSLSNNHNLSGYIITRSGKKLIFSFMNNNFVAPTSAVRKNMQDLLTLFYEHY